MVEVHPTPDEALSDAEQQLTLDQFRDLMTDLVPIHAQVRGLHGDAGRGSARPRRRRGRRGTGPGDDPHATSPPSDPPPGCAASCGCPATSRSAIGRSCSRRWLPGRAGSSGPATGPTCARRPAIMRALGARVEPDGEGEGAAERGGAPGRGRNVGYRVGLARRGRPHAARRHAGLRQLRHESATHRRDARRPAHDRRPGRGRFIAPPSGRSYHRATAPRWARSSTLETTIPSLPSP